MKYLNTNKSASYRRFCKTLELKNDPELIEEYKRVHTKDSVWPDITKGMKEVGIIDMDIHIHGTRLFMIMDTIPDFDHDKAMAKLSKKPASIRMGSICFPVSRNFVRCNSG